MSSDVDLVKTQDRDAEAIAESRASEPHVDGPRPLALDSGQSPSKQEDFGIRWIIKHGRSLPAPSLRRAVVLLGVLLVALYAVAIWIIYTAA
jgi:hypothetical protein